MPPIFQVVPLTRDLTESRVRRAFSTALRARVANVKLVFKVVFHPAKNLLWICASCARRASPTRSWASAYFSSAVAIGSSPAPVCCWWRSWELAKLARAIAWLNVFGWGLADGGAVKAACASAGVDADDRSWTFSLTVRPRSWKVSLILGG
ncbi:hypothetical protein RRF57_000157 [Xylaria bambusicola]|uniref:Uncharacterized protein n=1 Tax=Xylaria bambusicola TaxID=326684 RepID=A0AAN7Z5E4_9PEZI